MFRRAVWVAVGALLLGFGCQDTKLRQVPEDPPEAIPEDREGDATQVVPDPDPIPEPDPRTGVPGVIGARVCPDLCPPPTAEKLGRISRPNPIPAENQKPGDADWRSGRRSWAQQVELYASTDSAAAGELVRVKVSTSDPASVTASVYRLGHYGGAGARKVWSGGPYTTQRQAACGLEATTGLVECNWTDTFSFPIDPSWVSGLYVVRVTRSDGFFRFTPLVVRDDRAADLLFNAAVNTYQAYNAWGGESFYADRSGKMPAGRAHLVSFDRPYDGDDGAGQQLRYESHLVRFLEKEGYDVSYVSNLDFVRFHNVLDGVGVFVHGGHDEYWNPEQRAQLDAALADGKISLAHFGGNAGYWRTRVVSATGGAPLRTLVCYKSEPHLDPIPNSTLRYRDAPVNDPESKLFGAMYDGWQLVPFPLVVKDGSHWLFSGTGLTTGAQLTGLVGYEFDRVMPQFPTPSPQTISLESPVMMAEGVPSRSHAVDRTLPSGRTVFSAGTIYWPLALSQESYDPRIARMTLNVLERALAHRRAARTLAPVSGPVPTLPAPNPIWAQSVDAYAGVPGQAGAQDGPSAQATFNGPTAIAVLPSGEAAVAETIGNRIRLISADGAQVTTIAGDGTLGYRDGAGAQAKFRMPTGLLARTDGSLLVADSDNHNIRRLQLTATGWTVSTFAGGARQQGSTDGAALQARFTRPTALTQDAQGNVYVADQAGSRIRRISADGSTVSTIAGGSGGGFLDATTGAAAKFNNPSALAVGPSGDLYVFDTGNQKLRRIATTAPYPVTTLAGSDAAPNFGGWQVSGSFGFRDGPGTGAQFLAQLGLTSTSTGDLLLADTANGRIRKIAPGADAASTQVYTIAGSGKVGTRLGSGELADLPSPAGIAVLPNAKVLVSDPYHHVIRVITR